MTPSGSSSVRALTLIAASLLTLGATAIPAAAAQRFADPAGDDSSPTCPQNDPCDIHRAVELAAGGDEILLNAGTYALGADRLDVTDVQTIRPAPGAGRPEITSNGAEAIVAFEQLTLLDLRVTSTDSPGTAVSPQVGGLIDRTIIRASGTSKQALVAQAGMTVRNSLIATDAPSSVAVQGGAGGATLRNVTAVAEGGGPFSHAVEVNSCFGDDQHLDIANSIAIGTDADLFLVGAFCQPNETGINVSYSSYDPASVTDDGVNTTFTEGAGNQDRSALPPALGAPDFHQIAGSPTINAGNSAAAQGSGDLDGEARVEGTRVDIGADELTESPPAGSPPGGVTPPPAPLPRNDFTLGEPKLNKKSGTATLPVTVPGPGEIALRGGKVKPVRKQVEAAAAGAGITAKLKVKPKGKAKRKLARKGKAKISAEVTYAPDGGEPNAQSARVKLKQKS